MIEVILETSPSCPRCHKILARAMREICDRLGIAFTEKNIDTDAVAVFEKDSMTRTLDENWIAEYGDEKHKKLLRKHRGIFKFLSKRAAFPNLIIRWHDGMRPKELVIRGFPNDEKDPNIQPFLRNVEILLMILKKEVG